MRGSRVLAGVHPAAVQAAAEALLLAGIDRPTRLPLPAHRRHPRLRPPQQH